MKAESYVLDTSAILCLMEDEAGAGRVEQIITSEKVWLPWTVLVEIHYISQRERGPAEADRRYALMKYSQMEILWDMDEPTLLTAARLKATLRLSFADAVIAAYATRKRTTLVHKDPELDQLAGQLSLESLPYK